MRWIMRLTARSAPLWLLRIVQNPAFIVRSPACSVAYARGDQCPAKDNSGRGRSRRRGPESKPPSTKYRHGPPRSYAQCRFRMLHGHCVGAPFTTICLNYGADYGTLAAPLAEDGYGANMVLRLRLLGTGTPTPLLDRAGASFMIECGDDLLLFDCGPGAVRRLLEAGVAPTQVTHLFLTHLHYDHCNDYPYLVLTRWDQGAGRIPDLVGLRPPRRGADDAPALRRGWRLGTGPGGQDPARWEPGDLSAPGWRAAAAAAAAPRHGSPEWGQCATVPIGR